MLKSEQQALVTLPAGVASDVFLNVAPENVFDVFLLESSLHHQLTVAVNRAHCSQLGEEEGKQMFGLAMQPEKEIILKAELE